MSVAILVKGYPRLSETFIAEELHGLERRGLAFTIVSLRRPTDPASHPVHREIASPLLYLPEYLRDAPLRVTRAWRAGRRRPGYGAARQAFAADLARDRTPNRVRRFGQALVLAAELPPGTTRLHAHFLHTPASVARYASLLTGLPWSASAHAKDIWTTPEWEKREKLASLDWLVTCTRAGADHLSALAATPGKVELVYHGLDLARFGPAPARPPRDGGDADDPVMLLSVGRLVEKKGYDDLLTALALLPPGLHWRLVQIGGGPLRKRLGERATTLGLSGRISWLGAQPQDVVAAQYRRADLFALACRTARNGDRDGLPNVLLEAASQGLASVSTRAGAVAELVEHEATGLLATEGDPPGLAAALERLIRAPDLRERLGAAAAERVRERFAATPSLTRLAAKFGLASGAAAPAPCASPSTPR